MQTPPSGARGPRCKAHGVPAVQRSVNSGKNAGRWADPHPTARHFRAVAVLPAAQGV